jgi:hypothetical protein
MRMLWLLLLVPAACGGKAGESREAKMSRIIEELCEVSSALDCVPIETQSECVEKNEVLRSVAVNDDCESEFDEFTSCRHQHDLRCNGKLKVNPPECTELARELNDCSNR